MLRWLLVTAAMLLSPPAFAQSTPGMQMGGPAATGEPASTKVIAMRWRRWTGDVDPLHGRFRQDFVAGMIAHHQGAIDMAKVGCNTARIRS